MISILSFNRNNLEQKFIELSCRDEIAHRTNEEARFFIMSNYNELQDFDFESYVIDIIYFEISDEVDIERLKMIRKKEPSAVLMLLTNSNISPVLYLKPIISPQMLILRPVNYESFQRSNKELFESMYSTMEESVESDKFVLTTRENRIVVPYNKILYFEANNKKISVRVGDEEYDFYDSLENLSAGLPEYFIRTHRSYLVNKKKIIRICTADNVIELCKGIKVPISRTYKKEIVDITF